MKKLKLIMELIFIFILPLIFICFTSEIQKENNYEYDNNGNYETSEETIKISLDNTIIKYTKTPLYINYLDFNQLSDFEYTITSDNDVRLVPFVSNEDYTNHKLYIKTNYDFNALQIWTSDLDFSNNWSIPNLDAVNLGGPNNIITVTKSHLMIRNYPLNNYLTDYGAVTIKLEIFDLTQMFGSGYEPATIQEIGNYIDLNRYYEKTTSEIIKYESNNIISSNYKVNYTIWGNIKELIVNNLELNETIVVDVIINYTILWFIMFIIWHMLYLFFDMLIHLFIDWGNKEKEKING